MLDSLTAVEMLISFVIELTPDTLDLKNDGNLVCPEAIQVKTECLELPCGACNVILTTVYVLV